jgi:LysR family transcriptional regulator, transcriptional activator of the cysJI operon
MLAIRRGYIVVKLDLYRIFCEVAKAQSFSKAAAALYMTQPAVSQAIMQLEGELKLRLFTRTPRGVALTNEGQLLFEYISSALNLITTGGKKLGEIKNLMAGELRIGVGDTISRYYLLPYLESFHKQYRSIKLKVFNGTTIELCAMVKSGEIDMAVCNLPIEDAAFEIMECMDIHDIFVCGETYKDILSKPLSLEELSELPLILLETKSNSRQYVEKYMLSRGVVIKPEIELGSHELLLEFAKINLGISCVIKEFSQEYLKSGSLHEIQLVEGIPKRGIGICYLKSIPLSPGTSRFVDTLELVYT